MQENTQVSTTPPLPGVDLVDQVNKAIQTVATNFSGDVDPATLAWPYCTWADTANGVLKRRNAANTSWVIEATLFQRGYDRADILGPVSQDAGVPTGAIIERGSTANGEYTRWADGTQICRVRLPSAACGTADGAFFRTVAQTWTFPAEFAASPIVTPGCEANSNTGTVMGASRSVVPSTTSATIFGVSTVTGGSVIPCAVAVGRWF